mgnify:CR=1 FL=1
MPYFVAGVKAEKYVYVVKSPNLATIRNGSQKKKKKKFFFLKKKKKLEEKKRRKGKENRWGGRKVCGVGDVGGLKASFKPP